MLGGMNDFVTVYRSADDDATDVAASITELLKSQGIDAVLLDDQAPGVPQGAWEVQVPAADAKRAEDAIAATPHLAPDQSHDFDLVTVYRSGDGSSEGDMEALTIKNLLETAGIEAVLVGGDVPIPSLNHEVKVAREDLEEARRIITEARAQGSAAAEEAEAESESGN